MPDYLQNYWNQHKNDSPLAQSPEQGSSGSGLNFLSKVVNGLPYVGGLLSAGLSYLGDRKAEQAQERALKQQNEDNLKFYEDWKYYNSLEQQVKRAQAAGINPAAIVHSDNLPSAYQQQNSVVHSSPFGALFRSFGSAFASFYKAREMKLHKQQILFDQDYRRSMLAFQKQQLQDLNAYRVGSLSLKGEQLSASDRWHRLDYGLKAAAAQFKRDFYTDPNYLGYWQVKGSKQGYEYNQKYQPIALGIARNKLLQAQIFNRNFQNYLDAQITGMAARAQLSQGQLDKFNALYDSDILTQTAVNTLARNNAELNSSGFATRWNFGVKMVKDLMDLATSGVSIRRKL